MRTLAKLIAGAALATSAAVMAVPADAQVSFGVHFGPGYHRDWCYYHPYRCGRYGGGYYYDGYYRPGYGYWWHNGWRHHRYWDRDRWGYR